MLRRPSFCFWLANHMPHQRRPSCRPLALCYAERSLASRRACLLLPSVVVGGHTSLREGEGAMAPKRNKKKSSKKKGKQEDGAGDADGVGATDPLRDMMDRWLLCTGRFDVPSALALETWRSMTEHYLEPQRHYHTLRHIQELLEQMQLVEADLEQPLAVLLMVFFHDLIYDPKAKDNEDRSAQCFRDFCEVCDGRIPSKVVDLVVDAILITKHHMQCPSGTHKDIQVFLDMDIAILGSNKERYMQYMRQIRREYAHVPHDLYGKGRTQVLQSFLAARRIYKTAFFHDRYEATARANLAYEIAVLATPEVASGRLTISNMREVTQFIDANLRVAVASGSVSGAAASTASMPPTNAVHQLPKGFVLLDDPLAIKEADVLHCISMNMDMCLAFRDDHTKRLIALLLCTKVGEHDPYALDARQDHQLLGKHVLLHAIITQRERRGRGLASALLAALLGVLRDEGIKKVSTMCWKGTKQEAFFRKQGFIVVRDVDMSLPGSDGSPSPTTDDAGLGNDDGSSVADDDDRLSASFSPMSDTTRSSMHGVDGRRNSRSSSPAGFNRHASFTAASSANGPLQTHVANGASFRMDRSGRSPVGTERPPNGATHRGSMSSSQLAPGCGADEALVLLLQSHRRTAVEMCLTL